METTSYIKQSTTHVAILTFNTAQAGIAQCLSLSSTVLEPVVPLILSDALLTNNSELTIATTDSTSSIDITIRYTNTSSGETTDVSYLSIDNSPSLLSPWVGISTILLNGKRFHVRSLNIISTPAGNAFFKPGQSVPSGFSISIPSLGNAYNTNVVLLANSPYTSVDRNTTAYIDIAGINLFNSLAYLSSGNLFADPSLIRPTYPPIAHL